jgi:N-methylhydantoinase B
MNEKSNTQSASSPRDPMTQAVIKKCLTSLADEMGLMLVRTAHSEAVRDNMDFSTAIFDPQGRVVAQGFVIPIMLGAMPDALDEILARYGDDLEDGDVYILNDPDEGGMHLPDIFLFKPVFLDDGLLGFVGCVAHHIDVGGRVPGGNAADSTSIYQEGLQIPILPLYKAGKRNETLIRIIEKNVRLPKILIGDLHAQLASCHVGETGLRNLALRYGVDVLHAYIDDILDHTENMVRMAFTKIPDGEYAFTDYLDDDGMGSGPIRIQVAVKVAGSEIFVDFAGTSDQVKAALNATVSYTKASAYCAIVAVIDSAESVNNDGLYRCIHVKVPQGSILNPIRPAARSARGLTGFRVIDAMFGALHDAVPSRGLAGGEGGANMITISEQRIGRDDHILVNFVCGGWGGRNGLDGLEGVSCIGANLANVSVEAMELHHPVQIEEYGFVPDTGGQGEYRGCLSVVRQYRFLGDVGILSYRSDRRDHLPFGLAGGKEGTASITLFNPGTPNEELLPAKTTREIRSGDVIRHLTAGGGGYGPAALRDVDRINADLRNEKFSAEFVESHYRANFIT